MNLSLIPCMVSFLTRLFRILYYVNPVLNGLIGFIFFRGADRKYKNRR
jgi:hypothetical protein